MSVPQPTLGTVLPPPELDVLVGLATFPAATDLTVGKDGFNEHFNYGYMTEAALFTAARAALAAAGLSGTISFEQGQHEIITTFNKDGQERPAIMATVAARLTIRDKVGVAIECLAYGQGIDPADKAYAKAMSMASKYVVQKALMIAVQADDTDADEGHPVARRANGRSDGPASDKQLGYLCSLVKKVLNTEHGDTEPMALRLAWMGGSKAPIFAKIEKSAASDLIERLKKVETTDGAGTVILERLAAWESVNLPPDEAAAGQPDEPVAAAPVPTGDHNDDDVPFHHVDPLTRDVWNAADYV